MPGGRESESESVRVNAAAGGGVGEKGCIRAGLGVGNRGDVSEPRFIPGLNRRIVHVPVSFVSEPPVHGNDAELERRWLAEMAAGRHEALACLYRQRGSALFALLLRMLGSSQEAEELLQDAFVLYWKRASTYEPSRSSPWTWMVMLARGLAVDRIRSRSRRQVHLTAYEQEVASLEVEHVSPSTPLAQRETSDRVTAALRRLPDAQREAIELAFYRGWTHDEIARSSGQPLGTVKSHIRRGMLALRQLLKDFYA